MKFNLKSKVIAAAIAALSAPAIADDDETVRKYIADVRAHAAALESPKATISSGPFAGPAVPVGSPCIWLMRTHPMTGEQRVVLTPIHGVTGPMRPSEIREACGVGPKHPISISLPALGPAEETPIESAFKSFDVTTLNSGSTHHVSITAPGLAEPISSAVTRSELRILPGVMLTRERIVTVVDGVQRDNSRYAIVFVGSPKSPAPVAEAK